MAKPVRAVLDTNVFVSAALSKNPTSPTREVLERWQRGEFVLLICTPDDAGPPGKHSGWFDTIAEALLLSAVET